MTIEFRAQTCAIPELVQRAAKTMSGQRSARFHYIGKGRPGRTDPHGKLISIIGACMGVVLPGDSVCHADVELSLAHKNAHERGYVGPCQKCGAINWTLTE